MLKKIALFWTHPSHLSQLRLGIFVILIQILLILYFFESLPPQIPLFFSLPWGESRLGHPQDLLILPILSFSCLLINSFFALLLDSSRHKFFIKLLISTPILFALLSIISVIQIIRLSL